MTLLGRYVAKPAVPWLVSLVLLGTGIASAIGPYLGLPLMGWSRSGGDLRVAHFFALHIRQALPLAGWLIVASGVRRPMLAVLLAAAALLGLVAFVFVQALAGQPFIV